MPLPCQRKLLHETAPRTGAVVPDPAKSRPDIRALTAGRSCVTRTAAGRASARSVMACLLCCRVLSPTWTTWSRSNEPRL